MGRLDIDFIKVRPATPWMRWALLAIAIALCIDLGVSYYSARQRIAANAQRLTDIQRSTDGAARSGTAARVPAPEDVKIAQETVQRLAMPWGTLFRALENSASETVTLLAIDPQPRNGTVVISGEALSYSALLDYVAALGAAGTLERPHLLRHERRRDEAQDIVAFSIIASWSKPK
ncbi:MAG: PilN domain-containing protein [Betaproteobacteria bacterium]